MGSGLTFWVRFLCSAGLVLPGAMPRVAFAADGGDDEDPSGRVARLSYVRGAVSLQPAGESEWVAAELNRPLTTGDRLWSDREARAELGLGWATVRIDQNTDFSLLERVEQRRQGPTSAAAHTWVFAAREMR